MKRFLSLLLIIITVVQVMSFSAFGINTNDEAKLIQALENRDKTVTLSNLDNVQDFINEFVVRNPEYYYFSADKSKYWSSGRIDIVYLDYSDEDIKKFDNLIEEQKIILSQIDGDLNKVIYIHEYLMENCTYNFDYTGFTAYDCLINHKCVCEGYTKAFICLLHLIGVECGMVTSVSNKHAWIVVTLNGKKYYIDVTHDDVVGKKHIYLLSSGTKIGDEYHSTKANDWMLNYVSENVTGKYDNKEFDSAFWQKAINIMNYDNGYWYYTNGVNVFKCKYPEEPVQLTNHSSDDFRWYVLNSKRFYSGNYSDVVICNDRLYYSNYNVIRSMKKDGSDDRLEYTLTDDEMKKGYIYDLRVIDNTLYYYLQVSPSSDVVYSNKIVTENTSTHTHKMGEWFTVTEATGTTEGTKARLCTVSGCNYVETQAIEKTSSDVISGDVNSDGKVNTKDARLILRYAAKLDDFTSSQQAVADVTNDGKINTKDARKILRVVAKLETL